MVLVLSSARLIFCLVLLACVGSAFSLKCHKCTDPCDNPESVECSGLCLTVKENGKLKKECISVQEAQAEGVTTTSTVNKHCKTVNGVSRCFCNDKDDCNSDGMASSSNSNSNKSKNNSSTKPAMWTSLLWFGLACFYIRFN